PAAHPVSEIALSEFPTEQPPVETAEEEVAPPPETLSLAPLETRTTKKEKRSWWPWSRKNRRLEEPSVGSAATVSQTALTPTAPAVDEPEVEAVEAPAAGDTPEDTAEVSEV